MNSSETVLSTSQCKFSEFKMADLATLTRLRHAIEQKLIRFCNFLKEFNYETRDLKILETRLEPIIPTLSEYEKVQFDIEGIDNLPEQSTKHTAFEAAYYDAVSQSRKCTYQRNILQQQQLAAAHNANDNSVHETDEVSKIKLPTMNLPIFDGNYDKWLNYRDSFIALIDSNPKLSAI